MRDGGYILHSALLIDDDDTRFLRQVAVAACSETRLLSAFSHERWVICAFDSTRRVGIIDNIFIAPHNALF